MPSGKSPAGAELRTRIGALCKEMLRNRRTLLERDLQYQQDIRTLVRALELLDEQELTPEEAAEIGIPGTEEGPPAQPQFVLHMTAPLRGLLARILEDAKRPLTAEELFAQIKAYGRGTTLVTINGTLYRGIRQGFFRRVGKSTFGLAAWGEGGEPPCQ